MSSAAGSGGGLGARKQYSPYRNLWEEGSFLEPPSWGLGAAEAAELLAGVLKGAGLPLGAEEAERLARRVAERDPWLALEVAKALSKVVPVHPKRWRWWRIPLPPLLARLEGNPFEAVVVRSWSPLERALFPRPREGGGLASFATRAGRRYLALVFAASSGFHPPLAWASAAPPEAAYEPYFTKMVRLGALTIVDRVGWLPELERRGDRGAALEALLKGAALAGAGPRLLFALPRSEAGRLEEALGWLGLQPERVASTKRRELLLLDIGGL
jgi:hypothetical protein